MCNLSLTVQSNRYEIKQYFNAVLKLQREGERFPVDLDDVWPLVYTQKVKAVQFLTESGQFYEGEDYILLSQEVKQNDNGSGGHNRQVYMLSVPCMEYLVARKVRAVFEVYRKVFYKAIERNYMTDEELLLQSFIILHKKLERKSNVIARQSKRIAEIRSKLESEKEAMREKALLKKLEKYQYLYDAIDGFIGSCYFISLHGNMYLSDIYRSFLEFCKELNFELDNDKRKYISRKLLDLGYKKVNGRSDVQVRYDLIRNKVVRIAVLK